MRYIVTGGGTGGHVTPIKYVVRSLKKIDSQAEIAFIGQKGDRFASLIEDQDANSKKLILAGKFRRYQRPLWQTLIDIPTLLLNLRDAIYVVMGYVQSLLFLHKFKPDAIFVKGGYVSVPVGLAAATLRKPIITHDSDLLPGLANKVIARWATYNTVASSLGVYPYEASKLKVVGVPVKPEYFLEINEAKQKSAKAKIEAGDNPVVFVLGGSLGAKTINEAMLAIADDLIKHNIEVFHVAGKDNFTSVKTELDKHETNGNYHVFDFISNQDLLLQHYIAADLVISRAGATNTAEIAGLAKPAVIIPGQQLLDQLANAKELKRAKASVILSDQEITESPEKLLEAIKRIIEDKKLNSELSENIKKFGVENSSQQIAELILEVANG